VQHDEWATLWVIEVVPVRIAAIMDACVALRGDDVIVGELLPLPQHGDSGRREQGDDERLQFVPPIAVC